MTVAWPFLAVIGIFFSAWTKPAFPKGQWFQFHRALMIVSVVIALIGFILIFVANKDNSVPGLIEFTCVSFVNKSCTVHSKESASIVNVLYSVS